MRQGAAGPLVVALDEGTTGVRALLVDADGVPRAEAYREVLPEHPAPGLVEHDPEALVRGAADVLAAVLDGVPAEAVRGVGIATQRATAVVWETASGRAVAPALSWQDQRTAARCEALMAEGIFVSPLSAATKVEWILDRVDPDRSGVRAGRFRCGTVDAWLASRLTGGRVFATDASNASCSGFYDFLSHGWSPAILEALRVPATALPAVVDSSAVLGRIEVAGVPSIPLAALIGDQQAGMMGQLRLAPGEVKITYGTSAMIDLNAADAIINAWNDKYYWKFWRPMAAIRNADTDGNPATVKDGGWTPMFDGLAHADFGVGPNLITPPYPDHPSGNTAYTTATMDAFQSFFGTDDMTFYLTSSRFPAEQRYYDHFSDPIKQVIEARIWAGIHFRNADVQAETLGREVEEYTHTHQFAFAH